MRRHPLVAALVGAVVATGVVVAPVASATTTADAAPVRINVGGPAYTGADGRQWAADRSFVGGNVATTTRPVAQTQDDRIFQSVRWQMAGYRVPVAAPGVYTVRLGFAETAFVHDGRRIFSATAEGGGFVRDLDVHKTVKRDTAMWVTKSVAVRDGALDLAFSATKDNAFLAAIEVLPEKLDPAPAAAEAVGPAVGSQFHCMWPGASGYGTSSFNATKAAVLDKLVAAGVTSVRVDVGWDGLQPRSSALPDPSDWYVKMLDACVRGAEERGLSVLLTLDRSPAWARPAAYSSTARVLPADAKTIGPVSGWLAARYKNRVTAIEVWNEPNLREFVQVVDPVKYVAVLGAAHAAIKKANPGMQVVFSGADRVAVKPGASAPDDFYGLAYRAGAKGKFDVMGVHTYQGPSDAPADAPDEGTWRLLHMPHLLDLMARNGDGSKPVWVTEFGWSVHANAAGAKSWERGVSAQQQARYTLDALDLFGRWPQVTQAFVYAERQKATGNVHQDGYGLLNRDLSPRPVYEALRARAASSGRVAAS